MLRINHQTVSPFMDVKTILELWGVGVVKTTSVQKWDPIKKTPSHRSIINTFGC